MHLNPSQPRKRTLFTITDQKRSQDQLQSAPCTSLSSPSESCSSPSPSDQDHHQHVLLTTDSRATLRQDKPPARLPTSTRGHRPEILQDTITKTNCFFTTHTHCILASATYLISFTTALKTADHLFWKPVSPRLQFCVHCCLAHRGHFGTTVPPVLRQSLTSFHARDHFCSGAAQSAPVSSLQRAKSRWAVGTPCL